MTAKPISKVGILCFGFIRSAGGIDLLRMIVDSLLVASDNQIEIHIFVPDKGLRASIRALLSRTRQTARSIRLGRSVSAFRHLDTRIVEETIRTVDGVYFHHIDLGTSAIISASRRLRIEALIPAVDPLGHNFPIPWVGYIYDFQHNHLHEYFAQSTREGRNATFKRMLEEASAVIVNSRTVASEVNETFPSHQSHLVALPFSASVETDWLCERREVAKQYDVSGQYFMISNQFWLHKRHDLAFEALHRIAATYPNLGIVCTGPTVDYRDFGYFPRLLARLKELGLSERVRILGMIPKRDHIELMKGAVAVVQPTMFEGGPGGGSVYDAVSLGVPTIVSDIPVNMEIADCVSRYFRAGSIDSLAGTMRAELETPTPRPHFETLVRQGAERRRACGKALLETIALAISKASPTAARPNNTGDENSS